MNYYLNVGLIYWFTDFLIDCSRHFYRFLNQLILAVSEILCYKHVRCSHFAVKYMVIKTVVELSVRGFWLVTGYNSCWDLFPLDPGTGMTINFSTGVSWCGNPWRTLPYQNVAAANRSEWVHRWRFSSPPKWTSCQTILTWQMKNPPKTSLFLRF